MTDAPEVSGKPAESPPPRFRWSVLLVIPALLLLAGIYFGWRQQQQQQAIAELKSHGAIVRTEAIPIPFFEQIAGSEFSQRLIEAYWVGQEVTADELAPLARTPTLRKLELTNSTIDTAGLQHLVGLRDLYALHLSGTNIGNDALAYVEPLHGLEILSLNGTQVDDTGLKSISGLPKLERLFLNTTRITDAGMDELGRMKQLKELGLRDLTITDAGIAELRGLTHLEVLALDNNPNVTRKGLLALRETIPNLIFSLDEEDPDNPLVGSQ